MSHFNVDDKDGAAPVAYAPMEGNPQPAGFPHKLIYAILGLCVAGLTAAVVVLALHNGDSGGDTKVVVYQRSSVEANLGPGVFTNTLNAPTKPVLPAHTAMRHRP